MNIRIVDLCDVIAGKTEYIIVFGKESKVAPSSACDVDSYGVWDPYRDRGYWPYKDYGKTWIALPLSVADEDGWPQAEEARKFLI